jgi:hypothetical protein
LGVEKKMNRHITQSASANKTGSGASRTWIAGHLTTILLKEGSFISPQPTKRLFASRYYRCLLTNVIFDCVPEADFFVFETAPYGAAQQEQEYTSCNIVKHLKLQEAKAKSREKASVKEAN